MYYDQHLHSSFSSDSKEIAENHLRRALALGMEGLCFTEHHDMDFPSGGPCDYRLDVSAYYKELSRLQQQYQDRLQVGIGVELGIQPGLAPRLRAFAACRPFDFIIGSLHVAVGCDVMYPDYFQRFGTRQAYANYFADMISCLEQFDDFDVLGHVDYVMRSGSGP